MTIVVDASVVVAALADSGPEGTWAEHLLTLDNLAAPHLLFAEVSNVLRRAAHSGDLSQDVASLAHADLLLLRVRLFPYQSFASRVWDLRHTVNAYDAWYVALAEAIGAHLATLDRRLVHAPGPRCHFVTFQE